MATTADWTAPSDLTSEALNHDYHTLFGLSGTQISDYDDFLPSDAEFDASINFLGQLQGPEEMEWEQNMIGASALSPQPTHSSGNINYKSDPAVCSVQDFSRNDLVESTVTKPEKRTTKSSSSTKGAKREKQPRISPEAKQIFLDHYAYSPYPTALEIEALADRTKLEPKRVRTWFNNHRSRIPAQDDDTKSTSAVIGVDQKASNRLSKESLELLEPFQADYQLEAWKASSMQNEGAITTAIEAAVAESDFLGRPERPSYTSSTTMLSRAASVHSSWAGASSAGSAATKNTKYSTSSVGSNFSTFSRTRRRGRKRVAKKTAPYPDSQERKATKTKAAAPVLSCEDRREQPYFCTFPECGRRFKTQYDWTRHEQIHVPQTIWVCCGVPEVFLRTCPFCGIQSPTEAHLQNKHKFHTCASQPEEARTFYRKDQFVQHLHNTHFAKSKHPNVISGCLKDSEHGCHVLLQRWKRPAPRLEKGDPALHCGYCGDVFDTWEERRRHVSVHFSAESRDLSSWWPARLPGTLNGTIAGSKGAFMRCKYCRQDFKGGSSDHPTCRVWSCRFLGHIDDLPYRDRSEDVSKPFFVTPAHRESYRDCGQQFFRSHQSFVEHLFTFHGAQHPRRHHDYAHLEKMYSQLKRSVFEPSPVAVDTGCSVFFDMPSEPVTHVPAPARIPDHAPEYMTRPLPELPNLSSKVVSLPSLTSTFTSGEVVSVIPRPVSNDKSSSRWRTLADPRRFSRQSDHTRDSRLSLVPPDEDYKVSMPRFYIGFRSFFSEFPTLYYLKGGKETASFREEPPRNGVHLSEIQKGFVASLALSSALVGMASEGIQCHTQRDDDTGWIEFGVDEEHLAWANRPSG